MVLDELTALGGDRFAAVLSDGTKIRLSTSQVADFSLRRGMELSQGAVEALLAAASQLSCRERALRIIGARPMSCKELSKKLVEKGESPEDAEDCIQWLLDLHYLDDEQYAHTVVRHYAAKGYGAQRVKSELYRRGVPKEYWDEALENMPEMDDKAYRLLCSKLRSDDPDRTEIKRATDALCRRGFSWDEIKSALERFRQEAEE